MSKFQFYQTYGSGAGTDVAQGIGGGSNDWDFKAVDSPGPVTDPPTQAVTAGDPSMDVYVRCRFDQPVGGPNFSSITNILFYASVLNLSGCGDSSSVLASGTDTYTDPTNISKSGTWDPIPTLSVSGIDISTSGLEAGNAGWSDWVGLQLQTSVSGALAGFSSFSDFTVVWDEV